VSGLLLVAILGALMFASGGIAFEVDQIARRFGANEKTAAACALTTGVILACGVAAWLWARTQ
jgi:hypothetical protein